MNAQLSTSNFQLPMAEGMPAAARRIMNGKPVFTVPSKTVINFDSRFDKKLLCDGMTFTTGQACVYSCSFCYVEAMQKKAVDRFKEQGVIYPAAGHAGVVIRNQDALAIARQQIMSKPEEFRMAKKVIYSSPKVDVAGNMELVRETVEMCKLILELTNWDIRMLSKSNLLPKVAEMLSMTGITRGLDGPWQSHKERVIYGVSTGTLDDKLAAAFEQGCPKVLKRIESLHWLQDHGFRTFGMICPSLPQAVSHGGHSLSEKNESSVTLAYLKFAQDMAAAIRWEKCEHVWAEVINLRGDSFTKTIEALNASGYGAMAQELTRVSLDKDAWEDYAARTFMGHASVYGMSGKLRFLQYVRKDTRAWWEALEEQGAVVL